MSAMTKGCRWSKDHSRVIPSHMLLFSASGRAPMGLCVYEGLGPFSKYAPIGSQQDVHWKLDIRSVLCVNAGVWQSSHSLPEHGVCGRASAKAERCRGVTLPRSTARVKEAVWWMSGLAVTYSLNTQYCHCARAVRFKVSDELQKQWKADLWAAIACIPCPWTSTWNFLVACPGICRGAGCAAGDVWERHSSWAKGVVAHKLGPGPFRLGFILLPGHEPGERSALPEFKRPATA